MIDQAIYLNKLSSRDPQYLINCYVRRDYKFLRASSSIITSKNKF